jgi:hypothetical protein
MPSRENKALGRATLEHLLQLVVSDAPPGQRIELLAVPARAAKHAGVGAAAQAALTALSRQSIYDALRLRPAPMPDHADIVVAATIAQGAQTSESLAGLLGVDRSELGRLVQTMGREGSLRLGGDSLVLLGDAAPVAMRRWLEQYRWVHLDRYSVYIVVADGEQQKLIEAAEQVIGRDFFALLREGLASAVVTDELALAVGANDRREALEKAHELWDAIRLRADLPRAVMRVADVADPRRHTAALRR